MDTFMEFQGKNLDEAIKNACEYYNTKREKLEIDIVQDAKTGVFGLIGARRAVVRARRAEVLTDLGALRTTEKQNTVTETTEFGSANTKCLGNTHSLGKKDSLVASSELPSKQKKTPRHHPKPQRNAPLTPSQTATDVICQLHNEPQKKTVEEISQTHSETHSVGCTSLTVADDSVNDQSPQRHGMEETVEKISSSRRGVRTRHGRPVAPTTDRRHKHISSTQREQTNPRDVLEIPKNVHHETNSLDIELDEKHDGSTHTPFESLDQNVLLACAKDTAHGLIDPILGETPISVVLGRGFVEIQVDCGDDSGLLIGREGQTLASLQYLASRIVSRVMDSPVRVQFNVGDYRERQDSRLRELATVLAERVRSTGRSCSTRPLSSYHRRIIHMALQDAPDVQTKSAGEGALKRIIVQRKRQDSE